MQYSVNRLRPLSIGLEDFFNFANSFMDEANIKYPPYNINKYDDRTYVLEMALAGYRKQDIKISMHDGILTIECQKAQQDLNAESTTIHKGISTRQFSRSFTLADNVIVKDATMLDGMLTIVLEQIIPEEKKLKYIQIK